MKTILSQLIDDFQERELPELIARDNGFSEIPGKADVAIGMRRTGKTFFCYQKMKELLDGGVKRQRVLYLNFEDERLFDFNIKDFQSILDVYYCHVTLEMLDKNRYGQQKRRRPCPRSSIVFR